MYGMGFIVNSYIFTSSGSYIVDIYSPKVALGLRKLSSTATKCIRIRRSSDGLEQDIGFSGDDLDTSSMLSFIGGGGANCVKVYNQGTGGSTYDASNSTVSTQGVIATTGTIEQDTSKPCINLDISSRAPYQMGSTINANTVFFVGRITTQRTINYIVGNESPASGLFLNGSFTGVNGFGGFDGTNLYSLSGEDLNRHICYSNTRSGNLYLSTDGGSENNLGSFSVISVDLIAGRSAAGTVYMAGKFQECIIFDTDESANKTEIEDNINSYYSVY